MASATRTKVNRQQLELASLVAGRGVQTDPNYAPLHNTAGLIQVELRDYNNSVKSFGRARALDPNFFEAHMNYAAVNLQFRGFKPAEDAYRAALRIRNDYDARLGLALALRGQIDDSNFDKMVAASSAELAEANARACQVAAKP